MTYVARLTGTRRCPTAAARSGGRASAGRDPLGLWQNFGNDAPLETERAVLLRVFDLGVDHCDLANNLRRSARPTTLWEGSSTHAVPQPSGCGESDHTVSSELLSAEVSHRSVLFLVPLARTDRSVLRISSPRVKSAHSTTAGPVPFSTDESWPHWQQC